MIYFRSCVIGYFILNIIAKAAVCVCVSTYACMGIGTVHKYTRYVLHEIHGSSAEDVCAFVSWRYYWTIAKGKKQEIPGIHVFDFFSRTEE